MIEALEPPRDFPRLLSHIWSAFISLSGARTSGFSGPNPITFEQILAWKQVTEYPLEPWEAEAVKRLDRIYMGVYNG